MRHNKQLAQVRSRESFLWWRTSVRTSSDWVSQAPSRRLICLSVWWSGQDRSFPRAFPALKPTYPPLTHTHTHTHFSRWSTEAVHCGRALQLRLLWHINRWHRPPTSVVRRPPSGAVKFYWFQWLRDLLSDCPQSTETDQSPESGFRIWEIPYPPHFLHQNSRWLIKCLQRLLT